ncbi:MAG TPA: asparaginase domain-containing protein [Candidatus Tectomicrobia bacterium]|nr:asparaginase domain-containing protein [Candidatus Tectomicrobia bacterium]
MMEKPTSSKPKIAVFSGPTATIQNSEPLITSNKARQKYGLPLRTNPDGSPMRFDALRPQRLAAPVTLYIEQFSAHPLERDAAELYAPPDGYIDPSGAFHVERQGPHDVPVYEVVLRPEDGLYPLPYMARQANGQPWEDDGASPSALAAQCRQPFYPDASRLLEEIDRLGIGDEGTASLLSAKAVFDFYRALPSGGYTKGLAACARTDVGEGDIPPETLGQDFFPYRPSHLRWEPPMPSLARLTNVVQRALASGQYAGAIWLEGSPFVEETSYWLNLLIDTTLPIVGNASQRAHGSISNDGDRNIIDAVDYILSSIWAGESGRDSVGVVVIQDEQIFTAREVQKADARPGGYVATGGHGGIVGTMGQPGPAVLTFRPVKRHTHTSAVNLSRLPESVEGTRRINGRLNRIAVRIKDARGLLLGAAIPKVTIVKHARYLPEDASGDPGAEVDILARLEKNLREAPLAGFVAEGSAPFASMSNAVEATLKRVTLSGMPVVKVGRGNAEGPVDPVRAPLAIAGSNLTATKARLLLMACLLRFGSLPPAADPDHPTHAELEAIQAKLAAYQEVFDTH